MTQISNDIEFRKAIDSLDFTRQRVLAGLLVKNVLELCDDKRITRVVETATNADASGTELSAALKDARAATLDCHTRCGAEGDWRAQAGYFVARAATAAVTPEAQSKGGGPAWQAAMSSRMARTSILIDNEEQATSHESEQQYRILAEFLNS
jgi:phage protein D